MKISVVIPLYNKSETVLRTLTSVFNQTFQPEEIIVVNDGSTDGSEKIVANITQPIVKLINQLNQGVSAARNHGISVARSEWVAFLDADDAWNVKFLETIVSLHNNFPACQILATGYYLEDLRGLKERNILKKLPFKGNEGIITNYFEVAAKSSPPISSASVVVKKELLTEIGGFPFGIRSGEDLLTWAKIAIKSQIGYSTVPLAIGYMNESHKLIYKPLRALDESDFVGTTLTELILTAEGKTQEGLRKYISHWYKMRVSVCLRAGDYKCVWKYAIKSLRFNIFNYKVYCFVILSLFPRKMKELIFKLVSK